jgi:hypothetical protein|nr:hypothetical protein [Kofleriaceae bacterium]
MRSYLSMSILTCLLASSGLAAADAKTDKAIAIAEKEANSALSSEYYMDCNKELPKGTKWVDPAKAVVKDLNSLFIRVSWTGTSPAGIDFEYRIDVDKDLSGTINTDHIKVFCKKK